MKISDGLSVITLCALLLPSARAADGTWTNPASGGLWSVADHWSAGVVADGTNATATFNTLDVVADPLVVHLDTPRVLGNLSFGDTDTNSAAGWLVDNNGVPTNTLNLVGSGPTITVSDLGAKAATLNLALVGTGRLTKAGAGRLVLGGTNTRTGPLVLNAGTVAFGVTPPTKQASLIFGAAPGSFGSAQLDLSAASVTSSALLAQHSNTVASAITIGAGQRLAVPGNVRVGTTNFSTRLDVAGAGVWTVEGPGVGGFSVSARPLGTSLATATLTNLAAFRYVNPAGTFGVANEDDARATLLLAGDNVITASVVDVGIGVGQDSTGILSLGTNTTLSTDTIRVGVLKSTSSQIAFWSTGSVLTLRGKAGGTNRVGNVLVGYNNNTGSSGIGVVGSLVNWNNSTVDALIGLLELGYNSNAGGGTGAGTLQFNRGTLDITSARIGYKQDAGGGAAIGTLNIAGGTVNIRTLLLGEAALNGASVASLNLTGGTLTVSADLATTAVATSSVNIAGGTLDLGGGGVAHAIGAATATVDVVTFTAGTIRNLAEFNGGAGLVKSGAGVGTLDGSNSFTGGITLLGASAGAQLNLASLHALGSGPLTIAGGTNARLDNVSGSDIALPAQNAQVWSNSFRFVGTHSLDFGTGTVTLASTVTVAVASNVLALGGVVDDGAGTFGLTKEGSGTLVLSGDNTFGGPVSLGSGVSSNGPNTLRIRHSRALGIGPKSVSVTTYGRTLALDGSAGDLDVASDIRWITSNAGVPGNGSVGAPALLNLAGSNTLRGEISLTGGGGGTLVRCDAGSLTLAGAIYSIIASTRDLELGGAAGGLVSGAISDLSNTVGVIKSGAGTWTLAGSNTYSGGTTVNAGTLWLDGFTSTGTVVVATGSTLGGTGQVAGRCVVHGTNVPGAAGQGRLTVGSYTQAAGGRLVVALTGPGINSGLTATQAAMLGGALTVTTNGYAPVAGDAFTILTAPVRIGTFATTNLPPLNDLSLYWQVLYSATDVVVRVNGPGPVIGLSGALSFGLVPTGTVANGMLVITNSGNAALNVTNLSYPAGYSGNWTGVVQAGSASNVTIQFAPLAPVAYDGVIEVQSDAIAGPGSLAVSGTGAAAVISVSGSLAFGNVTTGQVAQLVLAIANLGNLPLAVTNISYPPGFSGAWTGTVTPGGSSNVTVSFAPPGPGGFGGLIAVQSDALAGDGTITCSGTGAVILTGFDEWALGITNAAQRGFGDDGDGDGYANLWEYSQGTDPNDPASRSKPTLLRTNGNQFIRFSRATNAVDLVLHVEAAYALTNGAEWSSIASNAFGTGWEGDAATDESPTGSVRQVTAENNDPGAASRALRVRVERP
jgi:autotransporter-associated beta strand protein